MSKQNGDRHSTDIQPSGIQPEQLTAYALGQLRCEELAAVKAAVGEGGHSAAHDEVRQVRVLAGAITAARSAEPLPKPSVELRAVIERKLDEQAAFEAANQKVGLATSPKRGWRPTVVEWTVIGGICCVLIGLLFPAVQASRQASLQTMARLQQREAELKRREGEEAITESKAVASHIARGTKRGHTLLSESDGGDGARYESGAEKSLPSDTTDDAVTLLVTPRIVFEESEKYRVPVTGPADQPDYGFQFANPASESAPVAGTVQPGGAQSARRPILAAGGSANGSGYGGGAPGQGQQGDQAGQGYGGYGSSSGYPGSSSGGGKFGPSIKTAAPGTASESAASVAELGKPNEGLMTAGISKEAKNAGLAPWFKQPGGSQPSHKFYDAADSYGRQSEREVAERSVRIMSEYDRRELKSRLYAYGDQVGNEQYEPIIENAFLVPTGIAALSTFSIDVDTASYANVRRFLNEGRLPPPSAVRIEELVNYFTYSYSQPTGKEPFSVNMEAAECPWNAGHLLLRVGLKGKEIHRTERPPSNLTFLLDVSGSMSDENKLPLLKATLMMFVAELTENDRVSIVTYAGDAGLRLPPTRGNEKDKIMAAIDSLSAGGSTHGSAGIQLAYEQAGQYFLKEGTNRVILATDGDLNVGVTSDDALVELIKEKAAGGTFLTVLGFGTGNLKDGKLEKLADNGNGIYAYIDGFREGRKVLVEQMSGSLVTIAKDVKIQIEFNPAQIASYRLLGYENRVLAAEDFNNDKKDAGEIGAGHTVTALYELVPVGTMEQPVAAPAGEPLKYQSERISQIVVGDVPKAGARELTEVAKSGELLTLKLRYKEPDGIESRLVEFPLKDRGGKFNSASKDLQFSAAVASFGMILRGSEHRGSGNLPAVAEIASGAIGDDPSGYRTEFVDLVRKAQSLGAK